MGSAWEARAGLIWVDFKLVMPQQGPIRWTLNSWAAQANHAHPSPQESSRVLFIDLDALVVILEVGEVDDSFSFKATFIFVLMDQL